MSQLSAVIAITPPRNASQDKEFFEVVGFDCHVCGGVGYHPPRIEERNKEIPKCTMCNGSGKIKAHVEICFVPDTNTGKT